ncbi:Holliday junction resolvase RecU [uncultured Duncaniella sp.]|uniref:Holliday junction resolvase RecU n=1 Tax=uncultured Duncaniella sp. TaxID=2768039 RepID=UPI00262CAC56|nr:Holliday junction resolvase RecU [uncultured Duncaniella sp.]
MAESLGKKAEKKIKEWLDRPEEGYCFDRIPDQMTGLYGSKNKCDFILFKSPTMYYIESKATEDDRFDFAEISEYQRESLLEKSKIAHVRGVLILLFATYQRAFAIDIREVEWLRTHGQKSLNIKKIAKWRIAYTEIQTIPNRRKDLLDYTGEIEVAEPLIHD